MVSYGGHNEAGRSTSKRRGRSAKIHKPITPFAWLYPELLESAAWRAMSPNTRKLIDFLMCDHLHNAGTENGNLKATHDQLKIYGLTGSKIREAVDEAVFLGLIRCKRGGRWAETNQPSIYRLTFYADREDRPATNEWKGKTEKAIEEWKRDRAARRKGKRVRDGAKKARPRKQIAASTLRSTVLPHCEVPNGKPHKT